MIKLHEQIEHAYHSLQAQDAQVILLHPQSRFRSLLIAKLINDPNIKTYYYALDPDDISVKTFSESLSRDLANQHPLFGRYLNVLPQEVYNNFYQHEDLIVETFVKELNELSAESFYFLLDEYDRSDAADDINRLIERLADHLPPNCKLVLNGRNLPRLPWVAMIAKQQAALLMDDVLIEREFYGTPRSDHYDIIANTLGPGQVIINNAVIDGWEGHLPRLLFFFALDRPVVTRSEICHAFWPDLDEDQAVNVFHVTKRRLHKALNQDILVHSDTHYTINPDIKVFYDVMEFVEKLVEGRNPNNTKKFESWKRVIELYNGPFLQGHYDSWIDERRKAYRLGYLEALNRTAEHWINRDRPETAIKYYEQAINEDVTREDVHRELMKVFTALGRRSEAVAHYQKIEKLFQQNKQSLSPETISLYRDIIS